MSTFLSSYYSNNDCLFWRFRHLNWCKYSNGELQIQNNILFVFYGMNCLESIVYDIYERVNYNYHLVVYNNPLNVIFLFWLHDIIWHSRMSQVKQKQTHKKIQRVLIKQPLEPGPAHTIKIIITMFGSYSDSMSLNYLDSKWNLLTFNEPFKSCPHPT